MKTKIGELRAWFGDLSRNKKFFVSFLAIIGLFAVFSLGRYWIVEAVKSRQQANLSKRIEKITQEKNNIEELLRSDIFGGKTPKETKDLFVTALRKGDIDLASKYFVVYPEKKNTALVDGLKGQVDDGKIKGMISVLERMQYHEASSDQDTAWYVVFDEEGREEYSLNIKKNNFSNVWKIEEL